MGETTHQVARHIESARADLGANLQELEHKVKSVTDWRHQFQKNPMTMMGVAFGGGIVLATMAGGRNRHRLAGMSSTVSDARPSGPQAGTDRQTQQVLETWNNIKGALIGVAAARFRSVIGEIVPGFEEQFQKTEREKTARD